MNKKEAEKLDQATAEKFGLPIYDGGVYIEKKKYPNITKHVPTEWNPQRFIYWAKKGRNGLDWYPSRDIRMAWLLVEKAKLTILPLPDGRWFCGKYDFAQEYFDEVMGVIDGHFNNGSMAIAPTAEEAICRAFLAVMGKEIK